MALFAADVEEHDKTPNEYDDRPGPAPWTHLEDVELLEKSDDADYKES